MSDIVIRASDLSKVYRLYTKPHYRFLDMFGLLRKREGAYTEHAALEGINLEVRRGEKVAFIGRNGAGKSTLLKLATQVIEPSSGRIEVSQGAHALLQIGAGFHPDFTGRENVYSYLAHLGVIGREADEKVYQIVGFSELEEYIDQPIKTYSTGMVARLMFSTSTAITPELLVLDEILGVGDAYFAHKSYERIKELCETGRTTVLLVSHDIYSASKLCERMIWLDRGRVMIDGPSVTVMKAYEDSIRAQEEQRLRKRNQNALGQYAATSKDAGAYLLLELASKNNLPLACPVYFDRFVLFHAGKEMASVDLANVGTAQGGAPHICTEATCWGESVLWHGRDARPMLDYGSAFRKISMAFPLTGATQTVSDNWEVQFDYWSDQPVDLVLRGFQDDRTYELGTVTTDVRSWTGHRAEFPVSGVSTGHGVAPTEINTAGIHGSGVIAVKKIRVIDHCGNDAAVICHGRSMTILIDYELKPAAFRDKAQVLMSFQRDGIQDICRVVTRNLVFDSTQGRVGVIQARFPWLPLAAGKYAISVMIAKEGYYDRPQTIFFSINPEVYTCLSRIVEFEVINGGIIGTGTGVVFDAAWHLTVDWSLHSGSQDSIRLPSAERQCSP